MTRPRPWKRIREWLRRLPPAGLAVVALIGVTGFTLAGVAAYRTYGYVQHDNEFCMSCHLMQDPYEAFARSEHRGLGCKACHQPTMVERSRMALAQVLERPEEIRVHAEVPNSACAGCHVEGDPERWVQIQSSAGHRVHLESDSVSLRGLQCVECHSTSIHRFSATRETCAQSGCHEDTEMRLGKMGRLTIHCVGCHDFTRPAADTVSGPVAVKPLQPRREECIGCHEMRELLRDFPADEPHGAVCGACHDPHRQETPADAGKTCAAAGCHARADTLTPLHRGLSPGVLAACVECHPAHRFRADASTCVSCHADVARLPATPAARLFPGGAGPAVEMSHLRHREVACSACHASSPTHGAVTVDGIRSCRGCHHTPPVAAACAACHGGREFRQARHPVSTTLRLSVGAPAGRALPFTHLRHERLSCTTCHREPLTLRSTASCDGCHQDHHRPSVRCIDCHTRPPAGAHTADVHLGCGGAGCHESVPAQLRSVPRTRNFCLACHQDRVDHEPQGNCAACHRLPSPRSAG
jgi:nitrate/TMAO reductase-like tetraheme cytochrome c subunit